MSLTLTALLAAAGLMLYVGGGVFVERLLALIGAFMLCAAIMLRIGHS